MISIPDNPYEVGFRPTTAGDGILVDVQDLGVNL